MLYLYFSLFTNSSFQNPCLFFPPLSECQDAQSKNNLGIQTFIRTLLCEVSTTCHS